MNTELITKYVVLQKKLEVEEQRRNERKAGFYRYEEPVFDPVRSNGRKPGNRAESQQTSSLASTRKPAIQKKSGDHTPKTTAAFSEPCCCRQDLRKAARV